MLRTEVVASKNIRKTLFFKIYNGLAIVLVILLLLILLKVIGPDTTIGKYFYANYNNIVRPAILIVAFLIFLSSMIVKSSTRSPKRLGSIEMDENEIRYLENDEVKETIQISELKNINFEYFSFRMRGNPAGCMNYLNLQNNKGTKTYEIVINNALEKASVGEILAKINEKIPVKVTYAYFLHRILKDSDFKF